MTPNPLHWRFAVALFTTSVLLFSGCLNSDYRPTGAYIWSRKGLDDGRFIRPRAMTIDAQDRVYVVDKTGRIQQFDRNGKFLRQWRIPEVKFGKPVGLGVTQDGMLAVADTHYFRVLFYTPEGELLENRTIGGTNGRGPGEFGFVTDIVQDSQGNYYVGEYGDFDRIQKFSPNGDYISQFGQHGESHGEFMRPQGLAMDAQDRLWVADACNHRIEVFDVSGDQAKYLFTWGGPGEEAGKLSYPYGLTFDDQGNLYVVEMGNQRVQKFSPTGDSLGTWGTPGKQPGQLSLPWAIAIDSQGALHVADTNNHRIQRFFFPSDSN